ncbi:hypothetical protein HDV62DRAFT_383718 [Trichoderma sp. SZMC 28011]
MSKNLIDSLQPHNGDMVTRVCDYTGTSLSWTPGPRTRSLEAIYPFIKENNRIAYHANPNVCFIATAVNFSKKRNPPLHSPLVASWFNCHDDENMSFEKRKRQWAWTYNELSNVATMSHIFHLELPHVDQIKAWQQWTLEEHKEALEVLKTGARLPIVDCLLSGFNSRNLFRVSGDKPSDARVSAIEAGTAMYPTLVRIGSKYCLTQYEFEYYLTIPSPRRLDRVFYPFHVLSRAQALQNGWDWNKVTALTRFMIRNLSNYCNNDAFEQGLQEVLLNQTNMIYAPWTRPPKDSPQYSVSRFELFFYKNSPYARDSSLSRFYDSVPFLQPFF